MRMTLIQVFSHRYGNKSCLHSSDFTVLRATYVDLQSSRKHIVTVQQGPSCWNDSEVCLKNGCIHKRDAEPLL